MITISKMHTPHIRDVWYKINFHSKEQATVYTTSLSNAQAVVELRKGKPCRLLRIPFTQTYIVL